MKAENKTYSAADLANYHNGNMTEKEMHRLEKAALEDPFLAEALEGYAFDAAAEDNISILREQIDSRTAHQSRFFLYRRFGPAWLRIAAVFILFGGIGYAFYRLNSTDNRNELSQNTPIEKKAVNPVPVQSDAPTNASSAETLTDAATAPAIITGKTTETLTSGKLKNVTPLPYSISPAPPVSGVTTDLASAADKNEAAKKFKVAEANESENRAFVDNTRNNTVDSRDNNRSEIQTKRQANNANVASAEYSDRTANKDRSTAKDEKYNQVIQEENSPNVRSANAVTLQKAIEGNSLQESPTKTLQPIDSVVFINYADDNMKDILNASGKPYEGIVTLSFTVNQKGEPQNIKVVTSLCVPCDEQAISLLKKGPKWIAAGGAKRLVSIEY
ncbi:MAG: energy transducer TonB [Ferruginibacter sp.]